MSADFPSKIPGWQRSLKACKLRPHQSKWIVACYHDDGFELAVVKMDNPRERTVVERTPRRPYAEFWNTIKALKLARGKWWVVGWRTRMGLDHAGLLRALERDEVALPLGKGEHNAGKPSGKVTLSLTNVEIDLVVGKHQVKVIDFDQLGMKPAQFGIKLSGLELVDCEETLEDYFIMCDSVGLSASRTTAAQTGWVRCRSRHLTGNMCINLDNRSRELERRAHYPGRNECFQLGDIPGKTYSMDVKSCYAYICSEFDVPVYCLREYPLGLPVENFPLPDGTHWIADCVIQTDTPDYPLRWGEQVVYPTGIFHTSLAYPEFLHAMMRDRVRKITRAAQYTARPAMASYAEWFQASKAKLASSSVPHMTPTLKAIFNASLGYTARRLYSWEPWEVQPHWKWWIGVTGAPDHSEPCVQARVLDGVPEWLSISGEPYESIPYLHATICSWARVHLLGIMEVVGRENVLYVDTDGLLMTAEGRDRLLADDRCTGSLPGQLAERFRPGRCRIGGLKNYRIGNSFVCAGGVETRRSLMADAIVLDTPTGRCDTHGRVSPFAFTCSDEGDGKARYANRMAGV